MNPKIIQFVIYGTVFLIALSVGKSMFAPEAEPENVETLTREVPRETGHDNDSRKIEEEKLEVEMSNDEQVYTLDNLYHEKTILASRELATRFALWHFPYDEAPKDFGEISSYVTPDVWERLQNARPTNASRKRTLTSYEIFEAYNQTNTIHWVVRLTGDVFDEKNQKIETVTYDYHIYMMEDASARLYITEFTPQKVS